MNSTITKLWRETGANSLIAIVLFGALLGVLYVAELLIPELAGKLLFFNQPAFCVGIPASIIGVAYILSIKNPANYTGFYLGVGSSALLGVQFYLNGLFDLTFLYFVVFIPFQIMAIMSWKKGSKTQKEEVFAPEFLNMSTMLITLFAFLAIIVVDYLFATFVMYGDGLCENVVAKIISGSMIAASVLANYWLIYKKNDSWLYWLVYSVAGMLLAVVVTSNIFSLVLFTFFLVINGVATIAWIKATPKEKYGWLKK
ncbi:MAG: nicotinamide mononucleotide transporter [Prevotellaceae bacterium]|jgi:nicotinamide riboside transporter PnuC|nr:nicotinamide mononucleotide transporter [Prevotellaceae bacterium]